MHGGWCENCKAARRCARGVNARGARCECARPSHAVAERVHEVGELGNLQVAVPGDVVELKDQLVVLALRACTCHV